jgi:hypothetical protein
MLEFKAFVQTKNDEKDPLENLIEEVQREFNKKDLKFEIFDYNDQKAKAEAEKLGVEELPALFFNNIRISGQLNEYFIFAVIAQILTKEGDGQKLAKFELDSNGDTRVRVVSEFLNYQNQMREDAQSFLFMIRESPDLVNVEKIKKMSENGTTIYLLTNFKEGKSAAKVAKLGELENVLIGHIMRNNMHMTISITIRKNRPFFGSFIRSKSVEEVWKGTWSPLIHDTVDELKKFYIPLFSTASPVMLNGQLPDPPETNRVVAKVKDSIERVKALFF